MAGPCGSNWGTVKFEIPDVLKPVRDAINTIAEFLVAILDIALGILRLVKTFLIGFLDPILAIVQAIIDEVYALIQDIRQLGIYLTGDWALLEWPFEDIKGGFAAYEQRMIARLADRSDPTRPDVSGRTKVLGGFFYLNSDISDIQRIIAFIKRMMSLFDQTYNVNAQPMASITEIRYGADAADIMNAKSLGKYFDYDTNGEGVPPIPQVAQIRWKVNTPNQRSPFNPFPPLPPTGFLVSVSSLPNGIQVLYDRPQADTDMKPSVNNSTLKTQPRGYDVIRDSNGKPLVLYGGADMVDLPEDLTYNGNILADGTSNPGSTRVYGFKGDNADSTLIPLEELDTNGYIFQRLFLVNPVSTDAQFMTGEYSLTLGLEDMPYEASVTQGSDGKMIIQRGEKASTVYVRIAACSREVASGEVDAYYDFSAAKRFRDATSIPLTVPLIGGEDSVGNWSDSKTVTFPNAYTGEYLNAVKTALAVLVLSRADLSAISEMSELSEEQKELIGNSNLLVEGTVKTPGGLESLRYLLGHLYNTPAGFKSVLNKKGGSPATFRKDLLERIERVAHDLYQITGPNPQLEKTIVENTSLLQGAKWGEIFGEVYGGEYQTVLPASVKDASILTSLDPNKSGGDNLFNGIAANPFNIGVPDDVAEGFFEIPGLIRRSIDMYEIDTGLEDGSDGTPVIVSASYPASNSTALRELSASTQIYAEKTVETDGVAHLSDAMIAQYQEIALTGQIRGSADNSPVFFVNQGKLGTLKERKTNAALPEDATIVFCRALLVESYSGQLMSEAYLALAAAASALRRPPQDGAWLAWRFLDSFPEIDDFLENLKGWLDAIKNALESIIETILKYIEFIESRIMELQQFIRRINGLLQSLLGLSFLIPECSALMLVSDGTQGLISDLVSSDNKPSDNALSYGAGLAMVIPFGPSLVMDLILSLFASDCRDPVSGAMMGQESTQDLIGIEGPIGAPTTDPEPEVL